MGQGQVILAVLFRAEHLIEPLPADAAEDQAEEDAGQGSRGQSPGNACLDTVRGGPADPSGAGVPTAPMPLARSQ